MTTSAGAVAMRPSETRRVRRRTLDAMVNGCGSRTGRIALHRSDAPPHLFCTVAQVQRTLYKRTFLTNGGVMSRLIRRTAAVMAALLLVAMAAETRLAAQGSEPWMGTWVLDRGKSTFSGAVPERRTMTFEKN